MPFFCAAHQRETTNCRRIRERKGGTESAGLFEYTYTGWHKSTVFGTKIFAPFYIYMLAQIIRISFVFGAK